MIDALVIAALAVLAAVSIVLAFRVKLNALFLALVALTLLLIGVAVARDTGARDYLAIQQQYQKDYSSDPTFEVKVQQLFPQFAGAKVGDTFRVERCISCHVPNIESIGPDEAAQRIACDFFKYEPNAQQIAQEYGFKSTDVNGNCVSHHPALTGDSSDPGGMTETQYYAKYGQGASIADPNKSVGGSIAGFLPTNVDPSNPGNQGLSLTLDAVGCVVCHNGNRLGLTEPDAHNCSTASGRTGCNLVINPEYSWSQGAQLYYQYCVTCHGGSGEGAVGPPLNNQDRLGYYNEDYYYRCIEYGLTGFEHYGSIMPNWGSIASDYDATAHPAGKGGTVNHQRVLSEQQIAILIEFIRQWEHYSTLP